MLLPFSKNIYKTKKYTIDLCIAKNGVVSLNIDNITNIGITNIRTNLARIIKGEPDSYTVWNSNNYFNTTQYTSIEQFTNTIDKRLGETIDWGSIIYKWTNEVMLFNRDYEENTRVLNNAIGLGLDTSFIKSIGDIKFEVNNIIYAYHTSQMLWVFIYKPEKKVYIFSVNAKDRNRQQKLFNNLIKTHSNKDWCTCENQSEVSYVENYRGESHGYICNKCARFVQVG